nr:hypothetical protein [Tanacetum cinerariifolium]
TDPHVLVDQTKSVSEWLEIVLTQPITKKGASSTAIHSDKEEASTVIHGNKEKASSTIKLEDLTKLVSQIQLSFKDLGSPEDDPLATSSKQPSVSNKEATKCGSSKAPIGFKTGHFKRRKESSSAMDSNPSRPSVSTPEDTEMHKEDQQATCGPTSLGVTSEERSNPQLSSGMSALNLNKPIFSASFIIHSEAASKHDVSADFTAEADPGVSAPNNSIPPQQGASSTAIHSDKEEASTVIHGNKEKASSTIKLEDLTKLVSQIQLSFKDLGSPEDDPVIIVD